MLARGQSFSVKLNVLALAPLGGHLRCCRSVPIQSTVVETATPSSIQEAEAGGLLLFEGQPGLSGLFQVSQGYIARPKARCSSTREPEAGTFEFEASMVYVVSSRTGSFNTLRPCLKTIATKKV